MPRERQSGKQDMTRVFPQDFSVTRGNRRPQNNGRLFSDQEAFGLGVLPVVGLEGAASLTLDRIPNSLIEFGIVFGLAILGGFTGVVVNRLFSPRR